MRCASTTESRLPVDALHARASVDDPRPTGVVALTMISMAVSKRARASGRGVRAALGLAALLVACRDESAPARTGDDRPEKGSLNERHEEFKRDLHEAAESLGQSADKAHRSTQKTVRRVGGELGVRNEILGAGGGPPDAGAGEP